VTPFQFLIHQLILHLEHLSLLKNSGYRQAHCHLVLFHHATGHGTWRTIGRQVCSFQKNIHVVHPGIFR